LRANASEPGGVEDLARRLADASAAPAALAAIRELAVLAGDVAAIDGLSKK
jgi:hypothetical protein